MSHALSNQPTLILDGNQRAALAATRALGRGGIKVVVADPMFPSLAGTSRYCAVAESYPSPYNNKQSAIDEIGDIIDKHNIGVVMPMTDVTVDMLLRHADQLPRTQMPCPSLRNYELASDKEKILHVARKHTIPVPKSVYLPPGSMNVATPSEMTFPVVIKPRLSRFQTDSNYVATTVKVANSPDILISWLAENPWLNDVGFLLQEYIPGRGAGVFAMYDQGQALQFSDIAGSERNHLMEASASCRKALLLMKTYG